MPFTSTMFPSSTWRVSERNVLIDIWDVWDRGWRFLALFWLSEKSALVPIVEGLNHARFIPALKRLENVTRKSGTYRQVAISIFPIWLTSTRSCGWFPKKSISVPGSTFSNSIRCSKVREVCTPKVYHWIPCSRGLHIGLTPCFVYFVLSPHGFG